MSQHDFARTLRNNMTPAERRLWHLLRGKALKVTFRCQVPRGPYILDFACLRHKLVIELDGSQHAGSHYDSVRDAWLEAQGFRVLRFWNREVLTNPEGVYRAIQEAILERTSAGR